MSHKLNRGFTLIEVMFSIAILSIGLLTVTSMIITSGKTSRNSAITDMAAFESQNEIAVIASSVKYGDLVSAEENKGRYLVKREVLAISGKSASVIKLTITDTLTNKKYIETFSVKK